MDMIRYRHDKKYRKHIISLVRKYQDTKKGKRSKRRNHMKRVKEGYYKDYMVKKRKKAKREGLCLECFKRKACKGQVRCRVCKRNRLIKNNMR